MQNSITKKYVSTPIDTECKAVYLLCEVREVPSKGPTTVSLKGWRPQGREGSSPFFRTIWTEAASNGGLFSFGRDSPP